MVVLSGFLVGAGAWASYHAPHRNDQYQLIQLGQCVAHGGRMYVDCWENKPPGIAWLGALALVASDHHPLSPWILPPLLEVAVLATAWLCLRRVLGEKTARKSVVITAVVFALRLYDTPSINPDFYSSMFELAAMVVFLRAGWTPFAEPRGEIAQGTPLLLNPGRASLLLAALAGLLWAAATTIKQVGCIGLLAITACALGAAMFHRAQRDRLMRLLASTWLGFLFGVLAVIGVLWSQGVLREAAYAVLGFNADLLSLADFADSIRNRVRLRGELAPVALPLWLGATAICSALWYRRHGGAAVLPVFALLMWWVAAALLAGMGPSGAMRYWQATFPPMLILAAIGLYYIQQVQDRITHPQRLTAFIVAATAALLLARPALIELRAGLAGSLVESDSHPTEREQLQEIAAHVRELTRPEDRIYVLDYRPGIYVYADRLPAVRFNYPRSTGQWSEILEGIRSDPPALLLQPDPPAPEFRRFCDAACEHSLSEWLEQCDALTTVDDMRFFRCSKSIDDGQ